MKANAISHDWRLLFCLSYSSIYSCISFISFSHEWFIFCLHFMIAEDILWLLNQFKLSFGQIKLPIMKLYRFSCVIFKDRLQNWFCLIISRNISLIFLWIVLAYWTFASKRKGSFETLCVSILVGQLAIFLRNRT